MHFSIPSLVGLSFLSLFASTGLAAGISKRSLTVPANITNTETIVAVDQLYAASNLIVDSKEFSDLSYVLTKDVVFTGGPGSFSGLAAAEESVRALFSNRTTLHIQENVYVYDITATRARSFNDGVLIYFGQGNLTGQTATIRLRFEDILAKEDGLWKIAKRTSVAKYRQVVGNRAVYHD